MNPKPVTCYSWASGCGTCERILTLCLFAQTIMTLCFFALCTDRRDYKSGLGFRGAVSGGIGSISDNASSHGRHCSSSERDGSSSDWRCTLLHATSSSAGRRRAIPSSGNVCTRCGCCSRPATYLHASGPVSILSQWGRVFTHQLVVYHRRPQPPPTTSDAWYDH